MNKDDIKVSTVQCVGFIMDGNRRFAIDNGQTELQGHTAGKEKFLEVIEWIKIEKIPHAVFYAFSTENWRRNKEEVEHLMFLFRELLIQIKREGQARKFNVRIIGRREDLPTDIQLQIEDLESGDADNSFPTIWIALSYGGRAEIISAVNKVISLGKEIDEEEFNKYLWTAGMPDPDIIIRTSGEKRLSNFLPWQSIYSELFFTDTYWPAFTKDEFMSILEEYESRERRIGR
ncbi:MAG: Ditrans,polycis-undecaprenyl-diphosphate synthase ((2E,6E)-farnesyl-diphosphate specific) [Parcubacteria bacterium OLB19]|jgi:undecaprenyl diphosphate synthase|nr:MAG: Ditrans,polycis-undecaprenyl-diphosphate synthase ((2E,6E)-farnesyl-diphosphate specific) [Parcubacteria bacterium OLB19]